MTNEKWRIHYSYSPAFRGSPPSVPIERAEAPESATVNSVCVYFRANVPALKDAYRIINMTDALAELPLDMGAICERIMEREAGR
jgi:hypothetical protein